MTGPAPSVNVRKDSRTSTTIVLPDHDREARIASVVNFLRNCLPGKRVLVEIGAYSPKRSNNLNSYYWGVIVKMISDATGYEPDEVHEILAMKFLPPRIVEIGGEAHAVRTRTSKLSTVDFQQFCEDCKRWSASELNLYIPDPNEYPEAA